MRLATISLIACAGLGLAACVQETPEETLAPQECGAAEYADRVGTPLSTFDVSKVKAPVRVLGPDSIMTMDHRPDRMNVYHNDEGVIEKIICG